LLTSALERGLLLKFMKKELEEYLWNEVGNPSLQTKRLPRDVINEMLQRGWINSPKIAWRTLEKWTRKGMYDYGICLDLGWRINRLK